MLIQLYTANEGSLKIHTNIRARVENRIYLQFHHNQRQYAEKCYVSPLSPQRWTKISTKCYFIQVNEIERAIVTQYTTYV